MASCKNQLPIFDLLLQTVIFLLPIVKQVELKFIGKVLDLILDLLG
jgi:hypothetical protein